ncbi:hypothetical protein [Actinomadura bangladeshensis]|uniref:Uncharacterized protein n=1 Tax=Actinomadura bangladeshensis TaxID=453573 RepID=A0A6L9QC87_9ACTN|nr:hypothetical protein [Actinomadura bangladeshensis]NEA22636.1 hypothetical protein [Actinomadura bangladeshensis]
MAAEDDLAVWLKELRAERGADGVAAEVAQARSGPECPHGEPGGALPHPQTGVPLCPICRAHQTACKLDALYCPKCQAIREAAGLPPDPKAHVP